MEQAKQATILGILIREAEGVAMKDRATPGDFYCRMALYLLDKGVKLDESIQSYGHSEWRQVPEVP